MHRATLLRFEDNHLFANGMAVWDISFIEQKLKINSHSCLADIMVMIFFFQGRAAILRENTGNCRLQIC